jgi:hypothetical protein
MVETGDWSFEGPASKSRARDRGAGQARVEPEAAAAWRSPCLRISRSGDAMLDNSCPVTHIALSSTIKRMSGSNWSASFGTGMALYEERGRPMP